jgi:uncharacterized protein (UPF0335 family)
LEVEEEVQVMAMVPQVVQVVEEEKEIMHQIKQVVQVLQIKGMQVETHLHH